MQLYVPADVGVSSGVDVMSVGDSNDVGSCVDVMWVDDGVGVGDGVAGDVDGMSVGDNIGDTVDESSSILHLCSAV